MGPDILWLGDPSRGEFQDFHAWLTAQGRVEEFKCPQEAIDSLNSTEFVPCVKIIAEAHCGEFRQSHLDTMRRAAPLAPMIRLVGSWCEGETRSTPPYPGAFRLHWLDALTRGKTELARLFNGQASLFSQPVTATVDDLLLSGHRDDFRLEAELRPLRIGIFAWSHDLGAAIADACKSRGIWAFVMDPSRGHHDSAADGYILAANSWSPEVERHCAALASRLPPLEETGSRTTAQPRPLVVILNFPRSEDFVRARRCGATTMLGAPFSLDEMFHALTLESVERRD